MKDLNELKKEFEDEILFYALNNIKEEVSLIYQEFGLDPESAMNCLQFLIIFSNEKRWLEVIDWATTLAQNTRFDLLENGIDIEVMNTLMSSLLEMIEIADLKLLREWEIKR